MTLQPVLILVASLLLVGCASAPDSALSGQRTLFSNPYVVPEIDRSGIGPACDVAIGRDVTCLGGPLIYPGRGRVDSLGNGQTFRLTRAQRDLLRDRAEANRSRAQSLEHVEPPPPPIANQPH
jgi:hypothetical protein